MNVYIALAGVIVALCAVHTALYLFMRAWERGQLDAEYEGYYQALLAELEKELP